MVRLAGLAAAVGGILLLVGCGERLVELPNDRKPAVPVALVEGPLECPHDTVLLADDAGGSGAGAVPADFEGQRVLHCQVDYTTMRSSGGFDRFTVRQWEGPMTPELRRLFDLPDRELRPARPCATASGGTTAVYLVSSGRRTIRVLLPVDDPCTQIRPELLAALPRTGSAVATTFEVSRPAR